MRANTDFKASMKRDRSPPLATLVKGSKGDPGLLANQISGASMPMSSGAQRGISQAMRACGILRSFSLGSTRAVSCSPATLRASLKAAPAVSRACHVSSCSADDLISECIAIEGFSALHLIDDEPKYSVSFGDNKNCYIVNKENSEIVHNKIKNTKLVQL